MSIINFCECDRKMRKMVESKDLSKSRINSTNVVFSEIYNEFGLTPSELLEKARDDEEQYIENETYIKQKPLDDRIVSIIQDDYKHYLDNKIYRGRKLLPNTKKLKITIYRAFLTHYKIELPKMPKIPVNKRRPTDEDIPSWDDINDALPNCKSPRDKALIAFAVTTGLRLSDIVSRKISDFIKACDIYFDEDEEHTLENLLKKNPSQIIPCWDLLAKKAENYEESEENYTITFNTPECTEFIFKYLKYRIELDIRNGGNGIIQPNEALFKSERKDNSEGHLTTHAIEYQFRALNTKLGGEMQKNDVYVKFSPHGLRKLFKTTCRRNLKQVDGNSDKIFIGDIVSLFTGHASKENSMKDFYEAIPKDDGENYLRKAYRSLIESLSIRPIKVKDVSTKEYEELQEKNKEMMEAYEDLEKSMLNQKEEYETEIEKLKSINNALASQVNDIEDRLNNIARANDITKIQEYASQNEMVNKYNLMESVIKIYNEDIEKNPNLFVDENYIGYIIDRAYNRKHADELEVISNPSNTFNMQTQILNRFNEIANNYIKSLGFSKSDYIEQKLYEKFWEMAIELERKGVDENSIDEDEVISIVKSIIT